MKAKTKTKNQFQRALIFVNSGEITLIGITEKHRDVAKIHCQPKHALGLAKSFARHAQHSLVFPVDYFLSNAHRN